MEKTNQNETSKKITIKIAKKDFENFVKNPSLITKAIINACLDQGWTTEQVKQLGKLKGDISFGISLGGETTSLEYNSKTKIESMTDEILDKIKGKLPRTKTNDTEKAKPLNLRFTKEEIEYALSNENTSSAGGNVVAYMSRGVNNFTEIYRLALYKGMQAGLSEAELTEQRSAFNIIVNGVNILVTNTSIAEAYTEIMSQVYRKGLIKDLKRETGKASAQDMDILNPFDSEQNIDVSKIEDALDKSTTGAISHTDAKEVVKEVKNAYEPEQESGALEPHIIDKVIKTVVEIADEKKSQSSKEFNEMVDEVAELRQVRRETSTAAKPNTTAANASTKSINSDEEEFTIDGCFNDYIANGELSIEQKMFMQKNGYPDYASIEAEIPPSAFGKQLGPK